VGKTKMMLKVAWAVFIHDSIQAKTLIDEGKLNFQRFRGEQNQSITVEAV
jgi:hypothetical protein